MGNKRFQAEQTLLKHEKDQLGTGMDPKFGIYPFKIVFNRVMTQPQPLSNFLITPNHHKSGGQHQPLGLLNLLPALNTSHALLTCLEILYYLFDLLMSPEF